MRVRFALFAVVVLAGCGEDNKQQPPADAAPPTPDAPVPVDPLTAAERAAIAQLSPLPAVPADTTNAFADNAAAAALGQKLWFDKSYAGALAVGDDGMNGGLGAMGDTGKVACASCHAAGSMKMDDLRSKPGNTSLGTDFGPRNALGAVNSSFYTWTNWGGRFDSQWSLPPAVAENAKIMNSTRLQVAHMMYAKYRAEYDALFPTPLDPALDTVTGDLARFPLAGKPTQPAFDNMQQADKDIVNRVFCNYGKAIAAYVRKLTSGNSAFDRFVAGDATAISPSAIRGIKVFLAKGCVTCHAGPDFTDNKFHALGVAQAGPHVPATDNGRFQDVPALLASPMNVNGFCSDDTNTHKLDGLMQDASQTGQFRTPSLRNVAASAPFMHAGELATLADVIDFYDRGGDTAPAGVTKDPLIVPLNLSPQDKTDLAAFLQTLTGEPVDARLLVDTSK